MGDGTGLAEVMLGLVGVRVNSVCEADGEMTIEVETTETRAWCSTCGSRAESQDRIWVDVGDLECFGRTTRLRVWKRRWRRRDGLCSARTWTEPLEFLDAQVVLTRRTGAEACRRVGALARPVSQIADELGVCWETTMNAVVEHGTPLVDDPGRVGRVRQLGVDETSFLRANRHHHTIYATGLVDLEGRRLIDMVQGNAAVDLREWTANADPAWLADIEVVATDLAQSFRAGLSPHLDHATRVADPFHVVRVANRCLDAVRRRVQNETLGHRGHKHDPLYRIRKLLLTGSDRLNERGRDRILLSLRTGDPNDEVVGAWLANYPALRAGYRIGECSRRLSARQLRRRSRAARQGDRRLPSRRGRRDPFARKHARVVANRDPRPAHHRRIERADRRTESVPQEGQALRPRLPQIRQLPAPSTAPHRRRHLACDTLTTTHPHALLPTQMRRAEHLARGRVVLAGPVSVEEHSRLGI